MNLKDETDTAREDKLASLTMNSVNNIVHIRIGNQPNLAILGLFAVDINFTAE